MKILDLVLKHQWYDMIDVGDKREEYRLHKPYWCKRLLNQEFAMFSQRYGYTTCNPKGYTHVRSHRGYTYVTMLWTITGISLGRGKTEWGAPENKDVFIIKLGSRL